MLKTLEDRLQKVEEDTQKWKLTLNLRDFLELNGLFDNSSQLNVKERICQMNRFFTKLLKKYPEKEEALAARCEIFKIKKAFEEYEARQAKKRNLAKQVRIFKVQKEEIISPSSQKFRDFKIDTLLS